MRLKTGLSVGTLQWTQTSFHLVIWKMSRYLSPSFESWHLGVHFTRGKHRVPLTYIFLREKSSWGACGKLAYFSFEDRESTLISRRYGVHGAYLQLIYWNWCFSRLWDGCLRVSLGFPKGCQTTCFIWCGMGYVYGANAGEMHFILNWFGVHQSILHSWGDISVLVLWQCSWGFSGVPSRKSRFHTCWIGNTKFLCTQCRGIGPHLAARGKSHEFSLLAAGTWDIFSTYGGDGHFKLGFVQRRQDSCLVITDTSGS